MRYDLGFSSPTHTVTRFLIIIIGTYLGFALFGRSQIGHSLYNALVLDPDKAVYSFEVWRVVSYGFLHDSASPMHVIFNALLLYMIGPQLEDRWGEKRFLIFIMASIMLGGAMVCLGYVVGLSYASVVGFSAATMGLVIAWGLTFSHSTIYIFGILPLTGIQLVYVTVGLEVIYAVSANSVSSAAHFGGIIAGFIFTLGLYKPDGLRKLWRKAKHTINPRR
jgi:membrane associated rhomboid family serine protease